MWATVSFWEREEEHCVTRLKGLCRRMFHSYPFPGNKLRCHRLCWDTISCVKFIMYLSIVWVKHILLQYKSTEITKKTVNLLLSSVSKLPGALWRRDGKRKENLQLRLWNLNIDLDWKSRCEMPIGGDDISNDVTTLVFQCLFTFALLPLRADWRKFDSSVDGEKGNWRWNSNSRDLVASSPSFSCPAARAPRRAYLQANKRILIVFSIFIKY